MRDRDYIYRLRDDWNAKTIKAIRAGGQTNRNYIVEYNEKKLFVRLPWESGVIDRSIEGKNILALSRNKKLASILPQYEVYVLNKKNILNSKEKNVFDVPDGTLVAQYIEAREYTARDFKNEKYQKALANMLYSFHSSGVRFVNRYDVFEDEIEKYRHEAEKYDLSEMLNIEAIAVLKNVEKQAKKELLRLPRVRPTHNDLIFQNFLIGNNGSIYLLDFEYAGMNKRGGVYYDFGFLFADNVFRRPALTKGLFEQFLIVADKVYGKKLDRKQIYAASFAVTVMQVWWGMLRYFAVQTKKEKQYFANYVQARVKKAKEFS